MKNQEEEKATLQAELFKAQTNNCKCSKMAAKEEKHLNESEKYNSEKLPDTEHISNTFIKTPCKIKDDFYIVTVSKLVLDKVD